MDTFGEFSWTLISAKSPLFECIFVEIFRMNFCGNFCGIFVDSEPVYHEKFCHEERDFHEVVKIGSQSIDFYGPKISSDFKNTKAEIGTKITGVPSFLCNDCQNFSTQYTKLHITQEHVFMTHQHC